MYVRLFPIDGGQPIDLARELTLVGRREDCDLRLDHKSVSKQHCVLVRTEGVLIVRDLGSTNGTRVNGQRVRRAVLVPDDTLAVASARFRVGYAGNDGQPQAAPDAATQHLESGDFAEVMSRLTGGGKPPVVEVHTNQLPDVYPDEAPRSE